MRGAGRALGENYFNRDPFQKRLDSIRRKLRQSNRPQLQILVFPKHVFLES